MRIKQLEAFRATIITGTMSAAAESLKTSQPTISRLLAALETELEIKLFRRENGRVTPTHEGLEFYRRVDRVHDAFASLTSAAHDLRTGAVREVRIISPPAVSMGIIPQLMQKLTKTHPDINAKLHSVDAKSYYSIHCEDEFDVVLGNRIGFEANIEQIQLGHVEFVCAMSVDNALAAKSEITPEDLNGETIISLLDDERRLFPKHERLFEDHNVDATRKIYTHSSATAYGMVALGMGVAVLEPFTAPIWERSGVATRPFRPVISYDFIAGVKPGARQSAAVSAIIAIAGELFDRY
ncbi:MAG: LysR substrate-binding domain-containing protein [Alphaproteobacteria bacterium]|nr:LysR substrate-binding domain-containing protein [Alphaproteobacteria bacterium]